MTLTAKEHEELNSIIRVIDTFSAEQFTEAGFIWTWKSVDLLVRRIKELETEILEAAWDRSV